MLVHIEPTAEQLGRLTVRTRNAVLFEADAVQPIPTPHEIALPEGVAEGDVEVTFVGINNGNQPVGEARVIKAFAAEPVKAEPVKAEPVKAEPVKAEPTPATGGPIPASEEFIPAAVEPAYAPPKYTPPKGGKKHATERDER